MFAALRVPAAEVHALAVERAAAARRLAPAALRALPACDGETVTIRGATITLTTYRDDLPDGTVRIVAQAYLPRILGAGTMTAVGFDLDGEGRIRELSNEDLWDYT